MPAADDTKYMMRCLELASKAEGMTYPNPLVGSVIVHDGKIIGEGYHLKAGRPHAEVAAVESVNDRNLLKSATLYVNLEPCSHFGKTPPCADFIIANSIPRVVAGTIDTSSKVSGKGIEKLRQAGCEVITGVAEEECRRINRRFFTFNEMQRPYITLKWAQSPDGFIDRQRPEGSGPGTYWITGKPERILVHRWRAAEQAILAGAGTIRADNPRLDVRDWRGNNPVRIILSGSGLLPGDLAINESIGSNVIFTFWPEKTNIPGAVVVRLNHREPAAVQICDFLYKWGIQSLFIEGGAMVLSHFINCGYWDEARIFYGRKSFKNGVSAPEIIGKLLARTEFTGSSLEILLNNK
jgi:diaminohydroxyphosphoribosylaminopyrimidine deaminase / 5-amino-6-(5-phosphoribosylamino)uracil reductase